MSTIAKRPAKHAAAKTIKVMAPPSFQRLDAKGRITKADDYVAVLHTFFDDSGAKRKLIWQRSFTKVANQPEALTKAKQTKLCGKAGRAPTIDELRRLIDFKRHAPAINPIFDCTESGWFWTSSAAALSPADCAWGVNFDFGYCFWNSRSPSGFVRAVRVSQ